MFRNPILYLLIFFAQHSFAQSNLPAVASGKINRHHLTDTLQDIEKTIDVWLPKDYTEQNRYAVIYFHDGQMLFDSTHTWNKQEWEIDETVGELLEAGQLKPCIVVGIWNAGAARHAEYFPQKPFESLPKAVRDSIIEANRPQGQSVFNDYAIYSDAYLKFLVNTIKPFIDSNYATLPDLNNTLVGGSSMGGLISLYAICEYPNVFGGAACISTHWPGIFTTDNNPIPGAFMQYIQANAPDPSTHKLYFDRGTETLDAWYGKYQQQADQIFRTKGFNDTNFKSLEFKGADHSEKSWSERMAIPLLFLLGED
ncbi:MAG: hypothetical protein RIQ47_996 [Bacteroidota bacterium]|jgi:enterochelin esterase-like enzyme